MAEETQRPTADDSPLVRTASVPVRIRAVGDTLVILLGSFLAASLLVPGATDLLAAAGITDGTHPVAVEATGTAMNFTGFLAAGVTYLYWRDDWSLVRLRIPTLREAGIVALGAIGLAATVQGLGLLARSMGYEIAENAAIEAGTEQPTLLLLFIPMQFLFVAPAEELVFRGLLQGLFRRAYGIIPGIAVAAAVFGLIHYPALVGEEGIWVVIGIAAASGAVLGVLYEYTENLAVPILVHGLWNAFIFATQYAGQTGAF